MSNDDVLSLHLPDAADDDGDDLAARARADTQISTEDVFASLALMQVFAVSPNGRPMRPKAFSHSMSCAFRQQHSIGPGGSPVEAGDFMLI